MGWTSNKTSLDTLKMIFVVNNSFVWKSYYWKNIKPVLDQTIIFSVWVYVYLNECFWVQPNFKT